jgi:hypothetical protein
MQQNMAAYGTNPTLHNFVRAIPGVGMLEDMHAKPYQTAAEGDVPGAFGDLALNAAGMIAPELLRDMPNVPDMSRPMAGASGAVKGAWQGATERVPVSHGLIPKLMGLPDVSMPASVAYGLSGGAAGAGAGEFFGEPGLGTFIGGTTGALSPIVRGAIKGRKSSLSLYDLRHMPPPDYSGYSSSALPPDIAQYGAPAPPAPIHPNEGNTVTTLPGWKAPQLPPQVVQDLINQERYPGTSGPTAAGNKSTLPLDVSQYSAPPPAPRRSGYYQGYVPPEDTDVPVHIPNYDYSAATGLPTPEELSKRISLKNVQDFTGKLKPGTKNAEFAQPPTGVVVPSPIAAQPPLSPVSPAVQQAVLPQPLTMPVEPVPATAPPSGLLQNLIKTVQSSPDKNAEAIAEHAGDIGHTLTTNKNAVMAQHLLGQGIDADKWAALPMEEKNAWVKKINAAQKKSYKPFGVDFRPGGYGRPAEEGARQVEDALRVLGAGR